MTRSRILTVVACAVVFYLVITALFGFRLGREIHAAKSNPYVGIASQVLGTQATETYVVQQSGLPSLITVSPAFWLALRLSE